MYKKKKRRSYKKKNKYIYQSYTNHYYNNNHYTMGIFSCPCCVCVRLVCVCRKQGLVKTFTAWKILASLENTGKPGKYWKAWYLLESGVGGGAVQGVLLIKE